MGAYWCEVVGFLQGRKGLGFQLKTAAHMRRAPKESTAAFHSDMTATQGADTSRSTYYKYSKFLNHKAAMCTAA